MGQRPVACRPGSLLQCGLQPPHPCTPSSVPLAATLPGGHKTISNSTCWGRGSHAPLAGSPGLLQILPVPPATTTKSRLLEPSLPPSGQQCHHLFLQPLAIPSGSLLLLRKFPITAANGKSKSPAVISRWLKINIVEPAAVMTPAGLCLRQAQAKAARGPRYRRETCLRQAETARCLSQDWKTLKEVSGLWPDPPQSSVQYP